VVEGTAQLCVYVYCNHRLVVKELRSREVGYFVTSEAGVPHPDASLCRVSVRLQGPARLMPWNSTKSRINYAHCDIPAIKTDDNSARKSFLGNA
jgi:hypothetical protein